MDESELESIWMTDILPIVGERMIPASHPITVFPGGQPAAGKTRAQRRLTRTVSRTFGATVASVDLMEMRRSRRNGTLITSNQSAGRRASVWRSPNP